MIAPRKKKFIKLIIMAWSVVLVITGSALPVFASSSLPVDGDGNWLPSGFYCAWYVYDTSTGSYSILDATSSISKSCLSFTFPYNTTGVTRIWLTLYTSGFSTFYFNDLYISGTLVYNSSVHGYSVVPISNSSYLRTTYYFDETSSSAMHSYDYFSDNPFNFTKSERTPFNRFTFFFDFSGEVSGNFVITFDNFLLDSVDYKSLIKIDNLDSSTEDLDDSVEALETALPLPTFDASAFASAEAIADDYTFFNDGLRFSFMESDLVTHIFILVVYFTCLSIAIFGHAGG